MRAQEQARLDALAEAVTGALEAAEQLAEARRLQAAGEAALREHVAALAGLGKTVEEIAELTELSLSVVRSARRPTGPPARGEVERAMVSHLERRAVEDGPRAPEQPAEGAA